MNNTLTITKERVVEAASKCKDAERTLKILFPEAFEEEKTCPCPRDVHGAYIARLFPTDHPLRPYVQVMLGGGNSTQMENGLYLAGPYTYSLEDGFTGKFLRIKRKK